MKAFLSSLTMLRRGTRPRRAAVLQSRRENRSDAINQARREVTEAGTGRTRHDLQEIRESAVSAAPPGPLTSTQRLVPINVAGRRAAAANQHGRPSAQCSRLPHLKPLHI